MTRKGKAISFQLSAGMKGWEKQRAIPSRGFTRSTFSVTLLTADGRRLSAYLSTIQQQGSKRHSGEHEAAGPITQRRGGWHRG